jgi:hypothetical protein
VLLAVVIDHAQSEANAAFQPAHTMPQADSVKSAAAFHRTISRRENEHLSLLGDNDFSVGLRARRLFHNHKFAALIVDTGLAQHCANCLCMFFRSL